MDAEELIRKCQAIALKEEDGDIVTFMGRIKKKKRERTAANCLAEKILLVRGINKEGLKTTMQQAWKMVKEFKNERMRDNIFLFKFGSKEEKKRILIGGHGPLIDPC